MTNGNGGDPILAERICIHCERPLVRGVGEKLWWFAQRRSCKRGDCLPPDKPDPVPPTPNRVATWAECPDACDRCGGLWKPMPGGVACRLCGREVYVEAALRAAMRFNLD